MSGRKRLPGYPVPTVRVGRQAVSRDGQGSGYGRLLLGHAVNCSMQLRHQLGVRVLLVDARHDRAVAFYRSHGFHATPPPPNLPAVYLPLGQ